MNRPERVKAVIKIGGHALDNPQAADQLMKNLAQLHKMDIEIVLVHGGGPQINGLLKRLGIESVFRGGLRVTSDETMEIVEMVLCGQRNKEMVRLLEKAGAPCCGISGQDGRTILAAIRNPDLGHVGEITQINTGLILALLKGGFLPVIAPIGIDEKGYPVNINADTAAAWLAAALKSEKFILVSDVPGVLDANGNVIETLMPQMADSLKKSGIIHGGMIPKVDACLHAVTNGCDSAEIVDGRQALNITEMIMSDKVEGSIIRNI